MDEINTIKQTRKSLSSTKWLAEDDQTLPFWIADMDLKSPNFITTAFEQRAQGNYYGYTKTNPEIKAGIAKWYQMRHNLTLTTEDIILANGVLASYGSIVNHFLHEGEDVLLLTPLYPPLTNIVEGFGHQVFGSQLICNDDHYEIDFAGLENQLKNHPSIKMMTICNPHNPTCRAWTVAELTALTKLAKKYNLLVVVDEIHAELVFDPQNFHSFAEVAALNDFDNYFVICSPAKAFNVAGLKASFVISSNHEKLQELDQFQWLLGISALSLFSLTVLEAIYTNLNQSAAWLDETLALLQDNYRLVKETLADNKKFQVTKSDGTFLAWIRINNPVYTNTEETKAVLKEEFGIDINAGTPYSGDGKHYIRFNFGCPPEMVKLGLEKLIDAGKAGKI